MNQDLKEKLWEASLAEEKFFLTSAQNSFNFFTSFISILLASTIAGIMQASSFLHFLFLLFGPLMVFIVSKLGKKGTISKYQRFLEAITVRAKLEDSFGMTKARSNQKDLLLWPAEPIVPERHIQSRSTFSSSAEFIDSLKHSGYQKTINRTFFLFQSVAVLLAIALIASAVLLYKNPYIIFNFH